MADDNLTPSIEASLTRGLAEERRAGRMAAWTKEFGKNDALNPWSFERFGESKKHFSPADVQYYLMIWDGRDHTLGQEFPPKTWSTGNRRYNIGAGDRVLLLRQGVRPIGFVAIGQMTGPAQEVPHIDSARAEQGETSLVVPIAWDYFEKEPVLVREDLPGAISSEVRWDARTSGIDLKAVGLFIDQEFRRAIARSSDEARAEEDIAHDHRLGATEKETLQKARMGQGKFRTNVLAVEQHGCRLTGVQDIRHLRASHIKPWAVCNNAERLDGHNGLMLSPAADHLFDQGFISFTDEGEVLVASPFVNMTDIERMGVQEGQSIGLLSRNQRRYMAYHRKHVFKGDGRR